MKTIKNLLSIFVILMSLTFVSCTDEAIDPSLLVPVENSPTNGGGTVSGFAMTAKINGVQFQANNPYGTNLYSSTNIWSYFPLEDFVMLQGRQGGLLGNPEINIWLKRSQIVVGTYTIGTESFTTPPSHFIDLVDNSGTDFEDTVSGTLTITEVNTTTKIVKGTFSFTTSDSAGVPSPVINYTVTNGTFNYKYMD
jgi:hypothetical protein